MVRSMPWSKGTVALVEIQESAAECYRYGYKPNRPFPSPHAFSMQYLNTGSVLGSESVHH